MDSVNADERDDEKRGKRGRKRIEKGREADTWESIVVTVRQGQEVR